MAGWSREGMAHVEGHHRQDNEERQLGPRSLRLRPRCECGWQGQWCVSEGTAYRQWVWHVRGVVGR